MGNAMSSLTCSICGGRLGRELLIMTMPDRFERHVGIAADGYVRRWVECNGCGTAANVHAPENLEKLATIAAGYYEVDFKSSSIADKYHKVMSLPCSQSDNAHRVVRIVDFLRAWHELGLPTKPMASRVLDIGAGTGVFLSKFLQETRKESWDWTGMAVEPDPVAAEHLRSLGLFEVTQSIFSTSLGLAGFDLCTLNKVVEHLPDPASLLHQVSCALSQNGLLYVEVPDKLTVFHRSPDDNILGALHHHLYTIEGLTVLCGVAGFVPIRIDRIFEPSGKITLAAIAVTKNTADMLVTRQGQ